MTQEQACTLENNNNSMLFRVRATTSGRAREYGQVSSKEQEMSAAARAYTSQPEVTVASPFQPAASTDSDRPVDLVHLSRFTMGNRDLEREVLLLFCKQSILFIERLKEAGDDKSWREAAHIMKGSARGIGAWDVGNAAFAAEQLTGLEREVKGPAAIEALEAAMEEACSFIHRILGE